MGVDGRRPDVCRIQSRVPPTARGRRRSRGGRTPTGLRIKAVKSAFCLRFVLLTSGPRGAPGGGTERRGEPRRRAGGGRGLGEHRGAAAPRCGTEMRYRLLRAAGRGGTGLRHRSGCCRPPVRGDRGAPMAEHRAAVQDNSYHSGAAAGTGLGWHRAPVGADVDPTVADNETNLSAGHQKGAGFVHCRDCHVPLWPEAVPLAPSPPLGRHQHPVPLTCSLLVLQRPHTTPGTAHHHSLPN